MISVPKRLIGFLADRPQAVAALTRIFLSEIERLLCAERLLCEAAGGSCGDDAPAAPRPRPGAVSFLHRFGSALNHHVHLHACATDGVFVPTCDGPPFAMERLSVRCGEDGRIACVRYVLPRHKAANWVGPGRGRKSTRPGANGVVELSPFDFLDRLADLVPRPRKHRQQAMG